MGAVDSAAIDSTALDSTRRAGSVRAAERAAAPARDARAPGARSLDSALGLDTALVFDPVPPGGDVRTPAARLGTYLALAVGPILAEELTPLGAGAAASQHEIALWPAVIVMTLGGWIATGLLYAFGRWRAEWIRRRFPRAATHL